MDYPKDIIRTGQTVHALCALLISMHLLSCCASATSPKDMLTREELLRCLPNYNVQFDRVIAMITVFHAPHLPASNLIVQIIVRNGNATVIIASRLRGFTPADIFGTKIGLAITASQNEITTYEPFAERIDRFTLLKEIQPGPLETTGGAISSATLCSILFSAMHLRHAVQSGKLIRVEPVSGTDQFQADVMLNSGIPVGLLGQAHGLRLTIDKRHLRVLRYSVLGSDRRVILSSEFAKFVRSRSGKYFPMSESVQIIPTHIPVQLPKVTSNQAPLSKRTQRTRSITNARLWSRSLRCEYLMLRHRIWLPKLIQAYDKRGNLLRALLFDYLTVQ